MCISQTNEFLNRNNSLFVFKRFKVYFMFIILKLKWQNHLYYSVLIIHAIFERRTFLRNNIIVYLSDGFVVV